MGGCGLVVLWRVGLLFVWWGPPICPRFPLTLALSHGGEREPLQNLALDAQGGIEGGLDADRASPANCAALVRVPLRFAKGTDRQVLQRFRGEGIVVVCLVGRGRPLAPVPLTLALSHGGERGLLVGAGLKPAPRFAPPLSFGRFSRGAGATGIVWGWPSRFCNGLVAGESLSPPPPGHTPAFASLPRPLSLGERGREGIASPPAPLDGRSVP